MFTLAVQMFFEVGNAFNTSVMSQGYTQCWVLWWETLNVNITRKLHRATLMFTVFLRETVRPNSILYPERQFLNLHITKYLPRWHIPWICSFFNFSLYPREIKLFVSAFFSLSHSHLSETPPNEHWLPRVKREYVDRRGKRDKWEENKKRTSIKTVCVSAWPEAYSIFLSCSTIEQPL